MNTYNVIGIMSGTSMDGVDLSLIKTDGINNTEIIIEKDYKYSKDYKKKLKKLIKKLPKDRKNQILYSKKNEKFITKKFLYYIKKFLKYGKLSSKNIDLIGLSGQTIFHNPEKKYSIQLGSAKEIYHNIKIPIVSNFRDKDLQNGGEGAPIGSFYHQSILRKINERACIINLGGIANITFSNKKKLISFDMGPANTLIDDLSEYFYKISFDKGGYYASKGSLIKKIYNQFDKDIYFKRKFPKSLDRYYFNNFYNELIEYNANDALHTASVLTVLSIIKGLKLLKYKINKIILTGGGRKNLFIKKNLYKYLNSKNIKIVDIENYGLNGDFIEAQMFGYLAVRTLKNLPLSLPSTTGVKIPTNGGVITVY